MLLSAAQILRVQTQTKDFTTFKSTLPWLNVYGLKTDETDLDETNNVVSGEGGHLFYVLCPESWCFRWHLNAAVAFANSWRADKPTTTMSASQACWASLKWSLPSVKQPVKLAACALWVSLPLWSLQMSCFFLVCWTIIRSGWAERGDDRVR